MCGRVLSFHKNKLVPPVLQKRSRVEFKNFIFIAFCCRCTSRKDIEWCKLVQHYPSPYIDASATKTIDFSDIYRIIELRRSSPDENSSEVALCAES
ncbi:hypothetical protein TNCV_161881 [Trichonephila clavipes]|nr:hypothetical protein TNCV_161881 [Trichonephila clavipes]